MKAILILLIILFVFCGATILLEAIPLLFVKNKKEWWKASVICNVVTNPIVNMITILLLSLFQDSDIIIPIIIVILEIGVVFTEAYFYLRMLKKRFTSCLAYSLTANLISFGVGIALQYL